MDSRDGAEPQRLKSRGLAKQWRCSRELIAPIGLKVGALVSALKTYIHWTGPDDVKIYIYIGGAFRGRVSGRPCCKSVQFELRYNIYWTLRCNVRYQTSL